MEYTIIATFRNDNQDGTRLKNLESFLNYYNKIGVKVIIVEQDAINNFGEVFKKYNNVIHVFVYNAGLFNKSWGYNIGVRFSRENKLSSVYMFCDVDIMLQYNIINDSYLKFNDSSIVSVNPYSYLWYMNNTGTSIFCKDYDWNILDNISSVAIRGFVVYAGGAIFIRDSCLLEINGWDEEYCGWGGEDNAMGYVIQEKYGCDKAICIENGIALHLWHSNPIGILSKKEHANYKQNSDRYNALKLTDIETSIKGRNVIEIANYNKYSNGDK